MHVDRNDPSITFRIALHNDERSDAARVLRHDSERFRLFDEMCQFRFRVSDAARETYLVKPPEGLKVFRLRIAQLELTLRWICRHAKILIVARRRAAYLR